MLSRRPVRPATLSRAPLTAGADPRREMPAASGRRIDEIAVALATLEAEERRLARIGLELPMARCREQRRYWSFLNGLFSMSESGPAPRDPGAFPSWPEDRIR